VTDPKVRKIRTFLPQPNTPRLLVAVVILLTVGGYVALILLGPANARWLVAGGFNRAAMHRLWTSAPEGIPADFLSALRRGVNATVAGKDPEAVAALTEAVNASTNRNTLETLGVRAENSMLPETHLWRLDIQTRTLRAEVLQRLMRYDEALKDLDYVLYLNQRLYDARHHRGAMLMAVGRPDDAIAEFDTLLAARISPEVIFARGIAQYLKSDLSQAAEDFARAAASAPHNRKYASWLAGTRNRIQTRVDFETLNPERILRTIFGRGSANTSPPAEISRPLSGAPPQQ